TRRKKSNRFVGRGRNSLRRRRPVWSAANLSTPQRRFRKRTSAAGRTPCNSCSEVNDERPFGHRRLAKGPGQTAATPRGLRHERPILLPAGAPRKAAEGRRWDATGKNRTARGSKARERLPVSFVGA